MLGALQFRLERLTTLLAGGAEFAPVIETPLREWIACGDAIDDVLNSRPARMFFMGRPERKNWRRS